VTFLLLGAGALVLMIRHVGAEAFTAMLRRCFPVLPPLLVLEGLRLAGDAASTALLYRRASRRVPLRELVRAHLLAYPVNLLMPAGRAAAEALKARELAPYVGGPRAAAAATMNQTLAMMSGALISVPCAIAALVVTGRSALSLAIALNAGISAALAFLLQLATRQRVASGWLARRFARAGALTAAYEDALATYPVVPAAPLGAMLANRACQLAQVALLLQMVGGSVDLRRAFVGLAASLVGSSVGDLVPGQIGTTDGAFALTAPALSLAVADAIAISVITHLVQLLWAILGTLVPFAWKAGPSPEPIVVTHPGRNDQPASGGPR
jgi:hypothetical protein